MKVTSKGKDFEKCPEGTHQAVCVDVVDLGIVDFEYQGKKGKRRETRFVFAVDVRDDDNEPLLDEGGKMYLVFAKFTASLSKNARLGPFLESWIGKSLPDDVRRDGFDLEQLIGRNAQIVVIHAEKGDNVYANIKGILPIGKGTKKIAVPGWYTRVQDREGYEPPFGSDAWEEQQAEKQRDGVPAGVGADEPEDDLPF